MEGRYDYGTRQVIDVATLGTFSERHHPCYYHQHMKKLEHREG